MERLNYVLKSYLRTRLFKIEKCSKYILENESHCLSTQELDYCKGFLAMMEAYYLESGLSAFPRALQQFDDHGMIQKPELQTPVICRVLENIGEVQLSDG